MQIPQETQQLVSTGINKFKYQLVSTNTSKYENDFLFEELSELTNPDYKKWYCKVFYKLGKDRVLTLASQAKADGRQPAKLFSKLLKEAYAQN